MALYVKAIAYVFVCLLQDRRKKGGIRLDKKQEKKEKGRKLYGERERGGVR